METDVRHSRREVPGQLQGSNQQSEGQRRLLPHELRHHRPPGALPEPPLAPRIADRVHSHDGRVAVPLLLARRALGGRGPHDRRPGGAARAVGADAGVLVLDESHGEHTAGAAGRGRRCAAARRLEEDR